MEEHIIGLMSDLLCAYEGYCDLPLSPKHDMLSSRLGQRLGYLH